MNVDDVPATQEYPANKLAAIFDHQHTLMMRYLPIEKANGLLETDKCPVDLHDRHGQARLKNFAWRVTEELAEAGEAFVLHPGTQHGPEELGDALHFLVELDLLAQLTPLNVASGARSVYPGNQCWLNVLWLNNLDDESDPGSYGAQAWRVAESLGKAMNCLKQKPWKNTHILTDIPKFHGLLVQTNLAFFRLCFMYMKPNELYDIYVRKNRVNDFRIRSQY